MNPERAEITAAAPAAAPEKPAPVGLDPRAVFAVFVSLCANPEALGRARQWVRSAASKAKEHASDNEVARVAGQYLMREAANLVSGFELQAAAIERAVERLKDAPAAAATEPAPTPTPETPMPPP